MSNDADQKPKWDTSTMITAETNLGKLQAEIESLRAALSAMNIELEKTRGYMKLLRKYSGHNMSCDVFSMKAECDCGFSTLLNSLLNEGLVTG